MLDRAVRKRTRSETVRETTPTVDADAHDDQTGTDAGHDPAQLACELSARARKNHRDSTRTFLRPIVLSTFRKTILESGPHRRAAGTDARFSRLDADDRRRHGCRGRSGSGGRAGLLLFRIRLTHEDLSWQSQTGFLFERSGSSTSRCEVARLKSVAESGAVAGRHFRSGNTPRRSSSNCSAHARAPRLHGLSDLGRSNRSPATVALLSELRIVAPGVDGESRADELQLTDRLRRGSVALFAGNPPRAGQAAPAGGTASPWSSSGWMSSADSRSSRGTRSARSPTTAGSISEGRAFELDSERSTPRPKRGLDRGGGVSRRFDGRVPPGNSSPARSIRSRGRSVPCRPRQ